MRTIWKYELPYSEEIEIDMPKGAQLRYFDIQNDVPCVWVDVESIAMPVTRYLSIHGTGHPIERQSAYVGSCQQGSLVWHLYDRDGLLHC